MNEVRKRDLKFDTIPERDRLTLIARFHERRLAELIEYEAVIDDATVIGSTFTKEGVGYAKLLRTQRAYRILALVWAASPYSADADSWEDWPCTQTVYGLAKKITYAPTDPGIGVKDHRQRLNKNINFVDRVVTAAEHHLLITRDRIADKNRNLLRGTKTLHRLMSDFALKSLPSPVQSGAQDV